MVNALLLLPMLHAAFGHRHLRDIQGESGAGLKLAGLVLGLVMAMVGRPAPSEPLLPVTHWQALFDETADAEGIQSRHLSRSKDNYDLYNLSYYVDANVSMFEATGPEGDYPKYVDGSGLGNGWIADGFVKLGRYAPTVQAVLEDYSVQNSQYSAAMALNTNILGAGARPGLSPSRTLVSTT